MYRSPSDGASNGLTTTLSAGINSSVTDIPLTEVKDMPGASQGGGSITVGSEPLDTQENLQQQEQLILLELFVVLIILQLQHIVVEMLLLNTQQVLIIF